MLQNKCFATGGMDGAPIMQVREEPHWPFPSAMDLREDQVIAGVLKEPSKERLSIQRAMQKGLLTQGTGLALLEHQAASGYIVDLAKNRMLSVRDATNAGLVGREHFNALFVAEKAVTGYTDPFSGNKISLFQAMKKGLIVKDHGIRLLEAQVATGGLIHPMHSHRLPVEQAYKWGYLDAEICNLISDPANHSKRCFDPNAREYLTYMQLLSRCVLDPVTGLLMFPVDKASIHLNEDMRKSLQSATTKIHRGLFQGQEVSLWDLLFSRYVSPHKRQDLLRQYKTGTITLQDVQKFLTIIITEAEAKKDPRYGKEQRFCQEMALPEKEGNKRTSEKEDKERTLKSRLVEVTAGEFRRGRKVSLWDLLHSKCIPKGKRKELLKLYKSGILTIDQMESVVTAIVTKLEEEKARESGRVTSTGKETGASEEGQSFHPQESQLRQSLQFIHIPVTFGEWKGQNVPVLDLLFSKHFPQEKRQELLRLYREGFLSPEQMTAAIRGTLEKVEASKRKFVVMSKRRSPEVSRPREVRVADGLPSKHLDDMLKSKMVTLPAGEFQGQQLSVWDLLFSQYLTQDKREELLRKYREGKVSVQELASLLTILASLHDLFYSLEQTATRTGTCPTSSDVPSSVITSLEEDEDEEEADDASDDDDDDEDDEKDKVLKSQVVEVPVGEFRGQKVSVWDLLHSRYFPEKKRKEILKLYRIGILTADQIEKVVTAIVTKLGEDKDQEGRCGSLPSEGIGSPKETRSSSSPKGRSRDTPVEALTFEFPVGEFQGRRVSMWDLLFSTYISEAKRLELLTRYVTGALSSQEMVSILTTLVLEAYKQKSTPSIPHLFGLLHPEASYMMFGPPQAPRVSMHDLFCPQEQEAHRAGSVTFSEITMTTTVVQGPEQKQG